MRNKVSKTNDFGFLVVVWLGVLGCFGLCLLVSNYLGVYNHQSSLLHTADRIAGLLAEDVKCS